MPFAPFILAATLTGSDCWNIYDAAFQRSASRQHVAIVTYEERTMIVGSGHLLVDRDQRIMYRADAAIHLDPGPPELGPYGPARAGWLRADQGGPTIANARVSSDLSCTNRGTETHDGHAVYHLTFTSTRHGPGLRELFVDVQSSDIWKAVVAGYIKFEDGPKLANFEIDMGYVGPYLLVQHINWRCGAYAGEYDMSDFTFPELSRTVP